MSVYVDNLREYPYKVKGHFKWCHLVADSFSELVGFSQKLGLSYSWLQNENYPHFDLTEGMRIKAVKMGAIEITDKELVDLIRKDKK